MQDYNHYNDRVNLAIAARLVDVNRRFYVERGRDFSETRLRVQPGVRRLLQRLRGDESILDLGCGNGSVARQLMQNGHRGEYLGLDFSGPLLQEAGRYEYPFQTRFAEMDLVAVAETEVRENTTQLFPGIVRKGSAGSADVYSRGSGWTWITAFALLHHIPGRDLRIGLLRFVRRLLAPDGTFISSNWQFSSNSRLRHRIQAWSSLGLTKADVDEHDYLLDWRRGGKGLRYVHEFRQDELIELATESGFRVAETFHADGADRRSGLYQVWRRAAAPG